MADRDASVDWVARLEAATAVVRGRTPAVPRVGIVLGSGLGAFADQLQDAVAIPYSEIPFFPTASVPGHAGQLVIGSVGGVTTAVMQGRVHGYEGYSAAETVFPVRLLCRLGAKALIITNAAGCINAGWQAGDLMRITDHINLTGRNPLVGANDDRLGPRFPDVSQAYDPRLGARLDALASRAGIPLRAGVYAGLLGPSYETPAEIRMLRTLGADAVGMSTVPEVIAAAHMGVPVVGISCLTNMAAGILDQPLSHAEVTETADRVRDRFVGLLREFTPDVVAAS